eukprot:11159621-Lingulodinium_polyedra.AAC.1
MPSFLRAQCNQPGCCIEGNAHCCRKQFRVGGPARQQIPHADGRMAADLWPLRRPGRASDAAGWPSSI